MGIEHHAGNRLDRSIPHMEFGMYAFLGPDIGFILSIILAWERDKERRITAGDSPIGPAGEACFLFHEVEVVLAGEEEARFLFLEVEVIPVGEGDFGGQQWRPEDGSLPAIDTVAGREDWLRRRRPIEGYLFS